MIDVFTLGLSAAAVAACGLLAVRVLLAAEADRHRETFRLTFPRSVDVAQVTAALRSVQGLLPRFPDRLVVTRSISFETVATADGIAHYLTAPAIHSDLIVGQLRAAIPGLRVVPAVAPDRYANLARGLAAVGIGSLRTDTAAESNAALLAACQPLRAGEGVIVQWSLSPTEPLPAWLLWLRGLSDAPQGARPPVEPELRAVCRVGVRRLAAGRPARPGVRRDPPRRRARAPIDAPLPPFGVGGLPACPRYRPGAVSLRARRRRVGGSDRLPDWRFAASRPRLRRKPDAAARPRRADAWPRPRRCDCHGTAGSDWRG